MPFSRGKKPVAMSKIPKIHSKASENQEEVTQVKRSSSPPKGAPKKRTAFIDITNAHKIQNSIVGIRKKDGTKKQQTKQSLSEKNQANLKKTLSVSSEGQLDDIKREIKQEKPLAVEPVPQPLPVPSHDPLRSAHHPLEVKPEKVEPKEEPKVEPKEEPKVEPKEEPKVEPKEEPKEEPKVEPVEELIAKATKPTHLLPSEVPPEFDVDSANKDDCSLAPEYAKEIFDYLKKREEKFVLDDYLPLQPSITENIRAILVDWMVEVQENFELNHETLYLAVKLTDHYLAAVPSLSRDLLQLVGSTAMLIAAKFEERCPPCVDDFLYICDDAYKRPQLITMEANILQGLNFDLNIPVSYRFLRRYAKCVGASMETLTLARYVCESTLLEMSFVCVRSSLLASACLLIALVTKDIGGWSPILAFHSGYSVNEVAPIVWKLHAMLMSQSNSKLEAIRSKYSHPVFFEVAKIPLVSLEKLEPFLQ